MSTTENTTPTESTQDDRPKVSVLPEQTTPEQVVTPELPDLQTATRTLSEVLRSRQIDAVLVTQDVTGNFQAMALGGTIRTIAHGMLETGKHLLALEISWEFNHQKAAQAQQNMLAQQMMMNGRGPSPVRQ